MTRFLTATTRTALVADLFSAGFHFVDSEGETRPPNLYEIITNGVGSAIYLGHIPIGDGYSTDFHANVTECEGIVFETEQAAPSVPYNVFDQ